MTKKLTLTQKVGKLRAQGVRNYIIAERLGISQNCVAVHYYYFKNAEKKKAYSKEYYKKNKDTMLTWQKKYYHNNLELMAENRYKRKCRAAGVQFVS